MNTARTRPTRHAAVRMSQRGIGADAVAAVQDYGRVVHTRGAVIFAVGRNEIAFYAEQGIDLSRLNGLQVVCCPTTGRVLTTYRNRNFRSLKSNLGRRSGSSRRRDRVAPFLTRLEKRA